MLAFNIQAKAGRARAGKITTPHGAIETPAFIPVGTKATVKAVTMGQVREEAGAQAVLANTYHLYLQPGPDIIDKTGGLGEFMGWNGPTFTDSGGFQAFSLAGGMKDRQSKFAAKESSSSFASHAAVDDDSVTFKSVIDGSTHRFTPEKSIEIQHKLGADIIFALDECAPPEAPREKQEEAVARTGRWAKRCLDEHRRLGGEQALFGIVQGGRYADLRERSAKEIAALSVGGAGFDGFGIGGTFDKADLSAALAPTADALPEDKPRHLLGIGEPEDLIQGIENGMDTFDCVAPTRMARHGTAYSSQGNLNLSNARFTTDLGPLDPRCGCHTCRSYTRAYIAHLYRAKEMLAATLVSVHNLHFLIDLAKRARQAIIDGSLKDFKEKPIG